MVILISIIYIYFSYIKFEVITDKLKYMNRFTYSFFNSEQSKLYNLDGNVLDFTSDRNSIFFNKNKYNLRYLNILKIYNGKNEQNLNNFILNNSIKYLIINTVDQLPNCLIIKEIGETYRKIAVRNFLIKPEKKSTKLSKLRIISVLIKIKKLKE